MAEPVDIVVNSMGRGGEAVAVQLAQAGLSAVGIEAAALRGRAFPGWGVCADQDDGPRGQPASRDPPSPRHSRDRRGGTGPVIGELTAPGERRIVER
jgi:hypothetical protein